MEVKQEFKLIGGEFSQTEAMEILDNIFSSKIQFHKLKNFSSQIRFGKDDESSMEKIGQLKESLEAITKLIKGAKVGDGKIEITSAININFINSEE